MTPLEILKHHFGYQAFRPLQGEIIASCLAGHDVLALLPTGGGKSICFQVPALALGGTALVISPLISLMKDQVDTLIKRGLRATYINSTQTLETQNQLLAEAASGTFQFIYVSPEKLKSSRFVQAVRMIEIPLVVVDEAHCIAEWGHDFRAAYLEISSFIHCLPTKPRIMAVTATATSQVRHEIIASLKLRQPQVFAQSFKRDNLQFQVIHCQHRSAQDLQLLAILQKHCSEAGIIYVATRQMAEELVRKLSRWEFAHHFQAAAYHGGLAPELKTAIQDRFLTQQLNLVIATNAFGMGIDKSNVRFVIHFQFPASLEHYYQEAGRAGRDGLPSHCYVLFNQIDLTIHTTFIKESDNKQRQRINLHKLSRMVEYLTTSGCRNHYLLSYFDEVVSGSSCELCDNCLCLQSQLPAANKQYQQFLETWLARESERFSLKEFQILHPLSLNYLIRLMPRSLNELQQIPGLGTGWIKSWAESFLGYFRAHT